jgi:hypothetical protein
MKPFKYVQSYRDRHGKVRIYFRRRGQPQIPLPDRIDTVQFERAYKAALSSSPEVARDKAITQRTRTENIFLRQDQPKAGIYLLLLDGEITYVGSSRNMLRRVADHRKNGRPFDKAFFIATREEERGPLEALLIRSIRPRQNRKPPERIANSNVVKSANPVAGCAKPGSNQLIQRNLFPGWRPRQD